MTSMTVVYSVSTILNCHRYPEYSLELEAEQHPDWDLLEVYLQARKHFDISALNFFAETLKTLTNLRPKV